MGHPRSLFRLFSVFFRQTSIQFLQQINVHPLYGAGIRTHHLQIASPITTRPGLPPYNFIHSLFILNTSKICTKLSPWDLFLKTFLLQFCMFHRTKRPVINKLGPFIGDITQTFQLITNILQIFQVNISNISRFTNISSQLWTAKIKKFNFWIIILKLVNLINWRNL